MAHQSVFSAFSPPDWSGFAGRLSVTLRTMPKPILFLLVVAAVAGGVYFFLNYEIQRVREGGEPAGWMIVRKNGGNNVHADSETPPRQEAVARPTVRIATFQLGRLDESKLANRRAADVLVRLFPQFDLIAVQGVRGKNRGVLVRLVEQIQTATGRTFDFATCPTQQRDAVEHYGAFVFDPARVEVDHRTVRFVDDRLDRFRVKPLTGSFRVRGPAPAEAFTFTLINVEVAPERIDAELNLLAEAYRAVRDDGRHEDDIILLGDLRSDDRHLGELGRLLGVTALLSKDNNHFTTTRGARLLDNVLLNRLDTVEFTGRVEVVDMMRKFEITMAGAREVSERLPVWAEFSAYEGGQAGHPASPP